MIATVSPALVSKTEAVARQAADDEERRRRLVAAEIAYQNGNHDGNATANKTTLTPEEEAYVLACKTTSVPSALSHIPAPVVGDKDLANKITSLEKQIKDANSDARKAPLIAQLNTLRSGSSASYSAPISRPASAPAAYKAPAASYSAPVVGDKDLANKIASLEKQIKDANSDARKAPLIAQLNTLRSGSSASPSGPPAPTAPAPAPATFKPVAPLPTASPSVNIAKDDAKAWLAAEEAARRVRLTAEDSKASILLTQALSTEVEALRNALRIKSEEEARLVADLQALRFNSEEEMKRKRLATEIDALRVSMRLKAEEEAGLVAELEALRVKTEEEERRRKKDPILITVPPPAAAMERVKDERVVLEEKISEMRKKLSLDKPPAEAAAVKASVAPAKPVAAPVVAPAEQKAPEASLQLSNEQISGAAMILSLGIFLAVQIIR
jgi:hypothetical protein